MNFQTFTPREGWQSEVERDGLSFHTAEGTPYWIDDRAFAFTLPQVERLRVATEEVWRLYLEATQHVITNNLFDDLAIPEWVVPAVKRSWARRDPSIYGRLDFIWNGEGDPKLIEFNADTPTSLIESSYVQRSWLERHRTHLPPGVSQCNQLEQQLVAAWAAFGARKTPRVVYFTHMGDQEEDRVTTKFMERCAAKAGLATKSILIENIGFDGHYFRDVEGFRMEHIFKLYPWEMIWLDMFGPALVEHPGVIEPIWKIVMQSKGLLPILSKLNPNHPNLLKSSYEQSDFGERFVKKPRLSRLGGNITLEVDGQTECSEGFYDTSGFIYQEYRKMPSSEHGHLLVGSWIANGQACGMSLRESDARITDNYSRFIPHFVTTE